MLYKIFCKVVGALRFSCISLFTYAPKSSKSFFILNPLKLDYFMFSTKTLCQMFSKLVWKVLSWKIGCWVKNDLTGWTGWAIDQLLTQSIEGCKKTFSLFPNDCSTGQGWTLTDQPPPQPIKVQSRGSRGPTVTCQVLNANN